VGDIEVALRDCLRHYAEEARTSATLAAHVRTRSGQLTRRARMTVALATVPAVAAGAAGSVALAKAGPSGGSSNHGVARIVSEGSASPSAQPRQGIDVKPVCTSGQVPNLHQLDRNFEVGTTTMDEGTFIRRYVDQTGGDVAGITPVRNVLVDGEPLSDSSVAIDIESYEQSHVWQLLIHPASQPGGEWRLWEVYNADFQGCVTAPSN
jgi:hypothetical protein